MASSAAAEARVEVTFRVGDLFSTYEELEKKLQLYKQQTMLSSGREMLGPLLQLVQECLIGL